MMWDDKGLLCFRLFHKKGHAIKHIDPGSSHQPCMFESITSGVHLCLGRLTSKTGNNEKEQLERIYLEHAEALLAADLEPVEFPTMGQNWEKEALSK
eukprot:11402414-Ditylum_brightwellii.AAC.1